MLKCTCISVLSAKIRGNAKMRNVKTSTFKNALGVGLTEKGSYEKNWGGSDGINYMKKKRRSMIKMIEESYGSLFGCAKAHGLSFEQLKTKCMETIGKKLQDINQEEQRQLEKAICPSVQHEHK